MNRMPIPGWMPVATGAAEADGDSPSGPDRFHSPDESYVRYMESWPDEDEEDDLSRLWTFTARTGPRWPVIAEPSAV